MIAVRSKANHVAFHRRRRALRRGLHATLVSRAATGADCSPVPVLPPHERALVPREVNWQLNRAAFLLRTPSRIRSSRINTCHSRMLALDGAHWHASCALFLAGWRVQGQHKRARQPGSRDAVRRVVSVVACAGVHFAHPPAPVPATHWCSHQRATCTGWWLDSKLCKPPARLTTRRGPA